jgi:hypothetical protein
MSGTADICAPFLIYVQASKYMSETLFYERVADAPSQFSVFQPSRLRFSCLAAWLRSSVASLCQTKQKALLITKAPSPSYLNEPLRFSCLATAPCPAGKNGESNEVKERLHLAPLIYPHASPVASAFLFIHSFVRFFGWWVVL